MNNLTILIGPPGSGKSTHALAMEASGYLRISQDDQGKGHLDLFHTHVTTGRDIVIDRMNFDKAQRDRYRLEAIKNGYTVNFVEFIVPRSVCFDRCMKRKNHPTIKDKDNANSALNTYFARYEPVSDEEGELLKIQYNAPFRVYAIMCDLDGTLCNLDHRLHYVKGEGKKDWGKFFRTVYNDLVYDDVRDLINKMSEWYDIVLCSGRTEDKTIDSTKKWLDNYHIVYQKLVMRPAGNYKADHITKKMLYEYEIKPYYDIKYVLDDRQQVVDMWRSIGLSCFQVRPGNF